MMLKKTVFTKFPKGNMNCRQYYCKNKLLNSDRGHEGTNAVGSIFMLHVTWPTLAEYFKLLKCC